MAEKQWTVHVVSHSHWDREWFLPFEQHRMRLVDLIDQLLDLFDKDQFSSFYLDGQTIVLDDYLQIRPQNEQRLRARIQEGRLVIGPWYVLQDEFLTCGESNVRNLLTGVREARKFGPVSMLGYFPDAFGNAGQMPQLLADAGMKAVLFGRGVKPVGFDNEVLDAGEYESCFSEMQWASPDGTSLFGVLFANWYNNGNEIPVAEADSRAYWDDRLPKAQKFASTSQLLFLNGCDHQPVQVDVDRAIETANRLYTNVRFLHSNYEDFLRAAQEELAQNNTQLSTVTGELISQETDGWTTLVNTSSCRVYLKQQNQKNETLLARQAEPMAAAGALLGVEYPHDFLDYAWKTLMQNHPHDSICGCVADEVNREVATRFEKSIAVGEELVSRAGGALMDKIAWPDFGQGAVPFAVFNPSGKCRKAVTCITLDIERLYTGQYDENYLAAKAPGMLEGGGRKRRSGALCGGRRRSGLWLRFAPRQVPPTLYGKTGQGNPAGPGARDGPALLRFSARTGARCRFAGCAGQRYGKRCDQSLGRTRRHLVAAAQRHRAGVPRPGLFRGYRRHWQRIYLLSAAG